VWSRSRSTTGPEDPGARRSGRLVPASLGGPNCQPIADPTYIYDPSGYVYEVLEDNRLEGVTAILETAPTSSGPWEIWDAEWFLQENPLYTDADGRYAWDVPEGWWRVRWEKDGYETQYSEALEVLPPHFDVNADLRNLTPPTVASASATAGGPPSRSPSTSGWTSTSRPTRRWRWSPPSVRTGRCRRSSSRPPDRATRSRWRSRSTSAGRSPRVSSSRSASTSSSGVRPTFWWRRRRRST
jgi:hypothetical protein